MMITWQTVAILVSMAVGFLGIAKYFRDLKTCDTNNAVDQAKRDAVLDIKISTLCSDLSSMRADIKNLSHLNNDVSILKSEMSAVQKSLSKAWEKIDKL